jgi:hypothetical protein
MADRVPEILGRDRMTTMPRPTRFRYLVALAALAVGATLAPPISADEPTRRAQEELRKRNLYFGEVDGKMKPELIEALKRYQSRKGFDVTGGLDEATANSLDIPVVISAKSPAQSWPDIAVLKSDAPRALSPAQPNELQSINQETPNPAAGSHATGGDEQSPAPQSSREDVTQLVQAYLRDAATDDVDLQVHYYSFPVDYFDHGRVERDFVVKDTRNYIKRWPHRAYMLIGPVTFGAASEAETLNVEFTIAFEVRDTKHAITGKTKNLWTLKPQGGNLTIVAIKEQRLHE